VLGEDGVYRFASETGELTHFATSLDGWAKRILDDMEHETGYRLARDWQAVRGPLAPGHRLAPKTPFVLGGKFIVDNLFACEDVQAMRFKGELARQLKDVPDG